MSKASTSHHAEDAHANASTSISGRRRGRGEVEEKKDIALVNDPTHALVASSAKRQKRGGPAASVADADTDANVAHEDGARGESEIAAMEDIDAGADGSEHKRMLEECDDATTHRYRSSVNNQEAAAVAAATAVISSPQRQLSSPAKHDKVGSIADHRMGRNKSMYCSGCGCHCNPRINRKTFSRAHAVKPFAVHPSIVVHDVIEQNVSSLAVAPAALAIGTRGLCAGQLWDTLPNVLLDVISSHLVAQDRAALFGLDKYTRHALIGRMRQDELFYKLPRLFLTQKNIDSMLWKMQRTHIRCQYGYQNRYPELLSYPFDSIPAALLRIEYIEPFEFHTEPAPCQRKVIKSRFLAAANERLLTLMHNDAQMPVPSGAAYAYFESVMVTLRAEHTRARWLHRMNEYYFLLLHYVSVFALLLQLIAVGMGWSQLLWWSTLPFLLQLALMMGHMHHTAWSIGMTVWQCGHMESDIHKPFDEVAPALTHPIMRPPPSLLWKTSHALSLAYSDVNPFTYIAPPRVTFSSRLFELLNGVALVFPSYGGAAFMLLRFLVPMFLLIEPTLLRTMLPLNFAVHHPTVLSITQWLFGFNTIMALIPHMGARLIAHKWRHDAAMNEWMAKHPMFHVTFVHTAALPFLTCLLLYCLDALFRSIFSYPLDMVISGGEMSDVVWNCVSWVLSWVGIVEKGSLGYVVWMTVAMWRYVAAACIVIRIYNLLSHRCDLPYCTLRNKLGPAVGTCTSGLSYIILFLSCFASLLLFCAGYESMPFLYLLVMGGMDWDGNLELASIEAKYQHVHEEQLEQVSLPNGKLLPFANANIACILTTRPSSITIATMSQANFVNSLRPAAERR
jgi:hypothetical protein